MAVFNSQLNIDSRIINEAQATITRATDSTQQGIGQTAIEGKKIGNFYFYTAWSFSGMSTGAGVEVTTLFGSDQATMDAATNVFHDMNEMLYSIQLAD